jgi:hypothetical protein
MIDKPRPATPRDRVGRTGLEYLGGSSGPTNSKCNEREQCVPIAQNAFAFQNDRHRIVLGQIVVSRQVIQIWVAHCAYCGGDHFHGGSGLDEGDPRDTFEFCKRGGRLFSHCAETGAYCIVPSLAPAMFFPSDSHHPAARRAMARLCQMGIPISNDTVRLPSYRTRRGAI